MSGRVEFDDAYLGGVRSGGKLERRAAGKRPCVAAVETSLDRKPRRLKLLMINGLRKAEIAKLAQPSFAAGSNVVSERLTCWQAVIAKVGCDRFLMATGSDQKAAQWPSFNWVNTASGNTKTALTGTHHPPARSTPSPTSPASAGASTAATSSTTWPSG